MKIAHISDLHLDANYKKENYYNTLHLIEYIIENKFDHVIISGDITENAEPASFELAREIFKRAGLLNKDKLTVVIGNHDIFGGVHLAEDVINFPAKCRKTNFYSKVNEFVYYFRETFEKNLNTHGNPFPFIKELDDIVITGFNSIAGYSVMKNPFASNGRISKSKLLFAEKMLEQNPFKNKKRIAVTHHHFSKNSGDTSASSAALWLAIEKQTMKLRGKKKVIKHFSQMGIELVLHGHQHINRVYSRKNVRFINSGGSILGDIFGKLSLNEININSGNITNKFVHIDKKIQPVTTTTFHTASIPSHFINTKEICLN
jgi:Icc protein